MGAKPFKLYSSSHKDDSRFLNGSREMQKFYPIYQEAKVFPLPFISLMPTTIWDSPLYWGLQCTGALPGQIPAENLEIIRI